MSFGITGSTNAPIPAVINNCNAYLEGNKLLGMADLVMPNIEFMVSELAGAGITGAVEVPVEGHVRPMTATVNFKVPSAQQFQMTGYLASGITFRAAVQIYDAGTGGPITVQFSCLMRGKAKVLNLGTLKPGEQAGGSNDVAVNYLKVFLNGVEMCEIDPMNGVCRIYGVDHLAAINAAI
jgi:hypothetical protein